MDRGDHRRDEVVVDDLHVVLMEVNVVMVVATLPHVCRVVEVREVVVVGEVDHVVDREVVLVVLHGVVAEVEICILASGDEGDDVEGRGVEGVVCCGYHLDGEGRYDYHAWCDSHMDHASFLAVVVDHDDQ